MGDKMEENSLEKAFEFIKIFFNELAQMLSDVNELMAKEGWDPVGSNVYCDTSRSIDNPDDWFPHYLYKNYINEDKTDLVKGLLIFFSREKYPQSIIFGNADVTSNSNNQWAIWNLWLNNNEKFKNLDGKLIEVSGVHDGHTIHGKLISIPLSDIRSKDDIKNKIIDKIINI